MYFKSCVDRRSRNLGRAALTECLRKEVPLVAGLMVQSVVLRALFVSGVQFQMHDSDYRYTKKTDTHNTVISVMVEVTPLRTPASSS